MCNPPTVIILKRSNLLFKNSPVYFINEKVQYLQFHMIYPELSIHMTTSYVLSLLGSVLLSDLVFLSLGLCFLTPHLSQELCAFIVVARLLHSPADPPATSARQPLIYF